MNNIPLTAWEQAVIVCIFAVFVLAMIGMAYKITKDVSVSFQKYLDKKDDNWQKYFDDVREEERLHADKKDKLMLEQQVQRDKMLADQQVQREKDFEDRNGKVVVTLGELSKIVQDMSTFNMAHHSLMQQAIQDMRQIVYWRYNLSQPSPAIPPAQPPPEPPK